MKICVLSDSHFGEFDIIDEKLKDVISNFNFFIHAGDVGSTKFLKFLSKYGEVVAVKGNTDIYPLDEILKYYEIVELEGIKIGIIHGGGNPLDIEGRVLTFFKDRGGVDIIVFGHTHYPIVKKIDNIILFNPGSCTKNRGWDCSTYGIIEIDKDIKIDFFDIK